MQRLNAINKTVETVLIEYPQTRVNDFMLYVKVLQVMGHDINQSLKEFAKKSIEQSPPSFESVTRARRTFAETNAGLFPEVVKTARKNEQYKYWKFNK